jgi:periplasmic divalent cation tolerance protein
VRVARVVAGRLLDEKLAACVSLLPASESIYDWQGERQAAVEVPVMIKTTEDAYPRLEAALREWHPYDVPEIFAVPVVGCLEAYAGWVRSSCDR